MKLVIGATGFLGSHVVRELVADGDRVRVLVRETSDTSVLDTLPVERVTGSLEDPVTVAAAMQGCSVVFYCAVDTRAWLLDSAPLYRTNVDALRSVLDVAAEAQLEKFVFTSTIATIGRRRRRAVVTEADEHNWGHRANDYVRSRVAAEDLVLSYARDRGLPAVALCVANTYGAGDTQPTPHGSFVAGAALGRLAFSIKGFRSESVDVADAAHALILAASRGTIGDRYIIAERDIALEDVITIAAAAGGRRPPRPALGPVMMYLLGLCGSIRARITRRPTKLTVSSVRLMHYMSAMDHTKAERELGWNPRPVTDAIREGAEFWVQRSAARRKARAQNGERTTTVADPE